MFGVALTPQAGTAASSAWSVDRRRRLPVQRLPRQRRQSRARREPGRTGWRATTAFINIPARTAPGPGPQRCRTPPQLGDRSRYSRWSCRSG
ncbi:MAG: hypothetical protein MZV65_52860 [Chromatiales bacterium]|nr:hypothetical protein [Chromatiales bacterium]